jgi:tetratricopeptide (TPR) repeat protein
MSREIFVSLTTADDGFVRALRDLLKGVLGDAVRLRYSTSRELEEGISHGEDWFQWIVQRVQECDFALIILTAESIYKPWILWESGAVYGTALTAGQDGLRKIRPLRFGLKSEQIPSPIAATKVQVLDGTSPEDIERFCRDVLHEYQNDLGFEKYHAARANLDAMIEKYCTMVNKQLERAAAVVSDAMVSTWRERLRKLLADNRASETEHIQSWIDIAFGREAADAERPLDVGLHVDLASAYRKARKPDKAIAQLSLAQKLAPRDIFVLRELGKLYLDLGERGVGDAERIVKRIESLDSTASTHNTECAALAARLSLAKGDVDSAIKQLQEAVRQNGDSYYLANLLAEALVAKALQVNRVRPDLGEAIQAFQRVEGIVRKLSETEQNVWTRATLANALIAQGDIEGANAEVDAILEAPDGEHLESIRRGFRSLARAFPKGNELLARLERRPSAGRSVPPSSKRPSRSTQ